MHARDVLVGCVVLTLGALTLANRHHINRLERRVRSLGVVDDIFREANGSADRSTHQRSLRLVAPGEAHGRKRQLVRSHRV